MPPTARAQRYDAVELRPEVIRAAQDARWGASGHNLQDIALSQGPHWSYMSPELSALVWVAVGTQHDEAEPHGLTAIRSSGRKCR